MSTLQTIWDKLEIPNKSQAEAVRLSLGWLTLTIYKRINQFEFNSDDKSSYSQWLEKISDRLSETEDYQVSYDPIASNYEIFHRVKMANTWQNNKMILSFVNSPKIVARVTKKQPQTYYEFIENRLRQL